MLHAVIRNLFFYAFMAGSAYVVVSIVGDQAQQLWTTVQSAVEQVTPR